MRSLYTIILFLLIPLAMTAQRRIYEKEDSIRIEQALRDIKHAKPTTTGRLIIEIADKFLGERYVGGTLEQGIGEPLVISCTKVDCTTYVELVIAIAMAADECDVNFETVCRNLERVRYRNGKNEGYTSRLHYISWWIADNAKRGIIEDVTGSMSRTTKALDLSFMSNHPGSYPLLADNRYLTDTIARYEALSQGKEVHYIPKSKLHGIATNYIKEGDIIAITTSVEGLDVAHIGFAYYNEDGILCLQHASSEKKMVIKDTRPLSNYLDRRKSHTGIMIFRAVF